MSARRGADAGTAPVAAAASTKTRSARAAARLASRVAPRRRGRAARAVLDRRRARPAGRRAATGGRPALARRAARAPARGARSTPRSPRGRSATAQFARAEEHLPALYRRRPALAAELSEQRLAPARTTLAEGPRERLTETLRAWLDRPGQVQAVAAELGVHPQTVRYRVKQLRELFGDASRTPRPASSSGSHCGRG